MGKQKANNCYSGQSMRRLTRLFYSLYFRVRSSVYKAFSLNYICCSWVTQETRTGAIVGYIFLSSMLKL